jgi:hypothetical protein
MRKAKKILLGLLGVFIVIQFIQPAQNRSVKILESDITKTLGIPDSVLVILKDACYDCHSNNTIYPWYSRVQPFGWLLAKHIKDGKADINFSEFGAYSLRRQASKMTGIVNSVKDGSMPLSSYRLLHAKARLTKDQRALLIDWATKTQDSIRRNK